MENRLERERTKIMGLFRELLKDFEEEEEGLSIPAPSQVLASKVCGTYALRKLLVRRVIFKKGG